MCLQYFGVFNVGTPFKQFTGCFDTGSSDVWLPLATCQSPSCQTHATYAPNASSTYKVSSIRVDVGSALDVDSARQTTGHCGLRGRHFLGSG